MSRRAASGLAWSLWALFFPLAGGAKYLEAQSGELFGSFVESVALIAAFAVFATVGALVASRRPKNPIGWILLAVGLGAIVTAFASAYATHGLVRDPGSLPGATVMAWLQSWSWYPSIGLMFTFLILLFPTGRLPSSRWRPLAWADAILLGAVVLPAAVTPEITIGADTEAQHAVVENPIGIEVARGALETIESGTGLLAVLLFALGVVSVFFRYRAAQRDERQQLKWFLYATALSVVGMLVGELVPGWAVGNVVFAALVSLIPISIAIAVLKHRLYDIDVVINKTLVYGVLAGVITSVYVGLVVGLGSVIAPGREPNLGLQIAATALVAAVFHPVRQRVQRLANRLVYGKRAEPYEVMAEFGGRMAGSIDVEEILPRTAETAARGVGAARARVRMFLPDGTSRDAVWPEGGEGEHFDLTLPVVHQDQDVGEIAVAKSAGDPLRPAEETLLRDLASQAGLALHNVRLTSELRLRLEEISRQAGELRESQVRLVTAADEERRRLERTIEDRVERPLGEMAAALREILDRDGKNPRAVGAGLDVLRGRAQETLEELREIARGIYPPLLADQGLAAALEALARRSARLARVRVHGLGRYPEEIEAGLYFCCLEAVRGATGSVALDLRDEGEAVRLVVEGAPGSDALTRIRDRVEALGGTLEASGATVRAVVSARALEAA